MDPGSHYTAPECALARIDLAELAWAAGFFDGEGSTVARRLSARRGYRQLQVSVPQSGHVGLPLVLTRFQRAILGMGRIGGPNRDDVYVWRATTFEEAQAVIALLWPHLGQVKRGQAVVAMRAVRSQFEAGLFVARPGRRKRVQHRVHEAMPARPYAPAELERVWAAGFLDAEGSFGLVRSRVRKDGTRWHRIRASASQKGRVGVPAAVHQRLRDALGEMGRIESHGDPDDFKWVAAGPRNVEAILALTAPWLGEVKVAQARRALESFAAQSRLHGDAERCARGHPYDGRRLRGGRLRRVCNACARLVARRQRARAGIAPRRFRDVARRYNS